MAAITHSAPSPAGRFQREGAGSVAEQGLEGLAGRFRAEAVQFLLVGVEDHDPALAGELTRQFAAGLAGADDDDAGEVVPFRSPMVRSPEWASERRFRHGANGERRSVPVDYRARRPGSQAPDPSRRDCPVLNGTESPVRPQANLGNGDYSAWSVPTMMEHR